MGKKHMSFSAKDRKYVETDMILGKPVKLKIGETHYDSKRDVTFVGWSDGSVRDLSGMSLKELVEADGYMAWYIDRITDLRGSIKQMITARDMVRSVAAGLSKQPLDIAGQIVASEVGLGEARSARNVVEDIEKGVDRSRP